jgi:hypothetical protein
MTACSRYENKQRKDDCTILHKQNWKPQIKVPVCLMFQAH